MQQSQDDSNIDRGFAVNQICQSSLAPSLASSRKAVVIIATYTRLDKGNTSERRWVQGGFLDKFKLSLKGYRWVGIAVLMFPLEGGVKSHTVVKRD